MASKHLYSCAESVFQGKIPHLNRISFHGRLAKGKNHMGKETAEAGHGRGDGAPQSRENDISV